MDEDPPPGGAEHPVQGQYGRHYSGHHPPGESSRHGGVTPHTSNIHGQLCRGSPCCSDPPPRTPSPRHSFFAPGPFTQLKGQVQTKKSDIFYTSLKEALVKSMYIAYKLIKTCNN